MKKFVMFNDKERKNIININNKSCINHTLTDLIKASSGIYINPIGYIQKKSKEELCDDIIKSYKDNKYPIVHEDSITAWGNRAVEQYGLEIRDILKMKPGQEMKVILMDRNVGEYISNPKIGYKYDPKEEGFTYGIYTHKKDLTGELYIKNINSKECFEWEINLASIGANYFWGPVPKNIHLNKLDSKIKVGWRGPAIKFSDIKYLPKYFIHYDTWWDDYLPYRYNDYLKVKKLK